MEGKGHTPVVLLSSQRLVKAGHFSARKSFKPDISFLDKSCLDRSRSEVIRVYVSYRLCHNVVKRTQIKTNSASCLGGVGVLPRKKV